MPISEQTVLGMAAATGELHLYVLSENEVRHKNVIFSDWKERGLFANIFVQKTFATPASKRCPDKFCQRVLYQSCPIYSTKTMYHKVVLCHKIR